MGTFYKGKNEYRWSYIHQTQGHYPLHKNIENALKHAYTVASKQGDPVLLQLWKPKRGKTIYIVKPTSMKTFSKNTLISYYKDNGDDVSYIRPKKYVLK